MTPLWPHPFVVSPGRGEVSKPKFLVWQAGSEVRARKPALQVRRGLLTAELTFKTHIRFFQFDSTEKVKKKFQAIATALLLARGFEFVINRLAINYSVFFCVSSHYLLESMSHIKQSCMMTALQFPHLQWSHAVCDQRFNQKSCGLRAHSEAVNSKRPPTEKKTNVTLKVAFVIMYIMISLF